MCIFQCLTRELLHLIIYSLIKYYSFFLQIIDYNTVMVVGYDTFSFVLDFSSESLNERLVTFEVMQENKRRTELKYFTKFDR